MTYPFSACCLIMLLLALVHYKDSHRITFVLFSDEASVQLTSNNVNPISSKRISGTPCSHLRTAFDTVWAQEARTAADIGFSKRRFTEFRHIMSKVTLFSKYIWMSFRPGLVLNCYYYKLVRRVGCELS